jgi:hypothetical protein
MHHMIEAVNMIAEHIIENGRTIVHKPWTSDDGLIHTVGPRQGIGASSYQSKFSHEPVQFHAIESGLMSTYVTTPRND